MTGIQLEGLDPMDPSLQQDPFPYYAALREKAPVYRNPRSGMYFVSRFDGVNHVLRNPKIFSSKFGTTGATPPVAGAEEEMRAIAREGYRPTDTMLTADPPIQTRYRKAVARAFNPKRIGAFEPRIRQLTDELIDRWPTQGEVDFMNEFAIPLPVQVIAHVLSIPAERGADVKRWSDDSVAALGVAITPERAIEAARGLVEMQKFLASLLEERVRQGQGDFLSELVTADFEEPGGEARHLDIPEMLSIVTQLMVAGNETTTKSINEITKLLIQNPGAWKSVVDDPAKIPAMIEEGMRMASPNQGLIRIATEDTEIEGVAIPKGARLWVMFGSANRDATVYPDPDRFDPSRERLNEHVGFGRGAHFCIGAPLARLELRVIFEQLTRRVRSMRFVPGAPLTYEPSFILRGLAALQIEVELALRCVARDPGWPARPRGLTHLHISIILEIWRNSSSSALSRLSPRRPASTCSASWSRPARKAFRSARSPPLSRSLPRPFRST